MDVKTVRLLRWKSRLICELADIALSTGDQGLRERVEGLIRRVRAAKTYALYDVVCDLYELAKEYKLEGVRRLIGELKGVLGEADGKV